MIEQTLSQTNVCLFPIKAQKSLQQCWKDRQLILCEELK